MSDQHLIGTELDDVLTGGDGNDWLEGLGGNDALAGGDGNDLLDGGAGQDTMSGGAGDDHYLVDDSSDWVIENADEGVDTVESSVSYILYDHIENLTLVGAAMGGTGNSWDNVITGNDGDNQLFGHGGNDTLIGGGGNDYMVAGEGNDRLVGGTGNDFMIGIAGDDVYEPGSGQDTVYDNGGDDEVRMAPGVDPDQVERVRESGSNHLILRVEGTTDSVTFYNWFFDPSFRIERVVFDDGTGWAPEETESLRYLGTAGDDFLMGVEWDERLIGFGGSDTLGGGGGNDVYEVDAGGSDYVNDWYGDDEVHWHGVSASQVEVTRPAGWQGNYQDLVLRVAGTADTLTLAYWFYQDPYTGEAINRVERVVFDDGTVWDADELSALRYLGTAGDDFLMGVEWDERLIGFGGSDTLGGGGGNDVYEVDAGGSDYVNDWYGDDEVHWHGVSASQVEVTRPAGWQGNYQDLVLRVAGTADTLTLAYWFYQDPYTGEAINRVERVVFDDGTVWDADELSALRYLGTAGDDFLMGVEWDERLIGFGGSDTLGGGGGNDVYEVDAGGSDYVNDWYGDDEVHWHGVSASQVEVTRPAGWQGNYQDLVLRVAGTADTLTLAYWFYQDPYTGEAINRVERVVFDDGTVWDADELSALRYLGTAGDDFLMGVEWDERLIGFGGSDTLGGGGGNDVYEVDAGGSDYVNDWYGDDEVHWHGVSASQVEVTRPAGWQGNYQDLVLRVAGTADTLTLAYWFYQDPYTGEAINRVERVVFDDGTVWDADELSALRYLGTAGDDFLMGVEWDERLIGFGGSDTLGGGGGNDVYEVDAGGSDYVNDWYGDDEVHWHGVSASQVEVTRPAGWQGNYQDLVLRVAGTADTLTLAYWFYQDPYTGEAINRVERVVFDDGTVWNIDELGALRILGTPGDDILVGAEWSERLEGLGGMDYMFGGLGDDVYVPGPLGEQYAPADFILDNGGDDELHLEGVNPDDVSRIRLGDDLTFPVYGVGPLMRISGWFAGQQNEIERIVFDDGTVWSVADSTALRILGTDADDYLTGELYSERIDARGGSDYIFAGGGSDVVVLQAGGQDVVGVASNFGGEVEVHWQGVSPDQVERFRQDGSEHLTLRIAGTTDTLTLTSWFLSEFRVERVVFDDGTVWDEMDLFPNDAPVLATPLPDRAVPEGAAFLHTLPSQVFTDPDGDALTYTASLANGDPLPDWLLFSAASRTFYGTAPAGSIGTYTVRLTAADPSGASASDDFDFTVAFEGIVNGTEGDDTLQGTAGRDAIYGLGGHDFLFGVEGDDRLYGGDGGDQLVAHLGNDRLDGGAGQDNLYGGWGSDVYMFARGTGTDYAWEWAGADPSDYDIVEVAADILPDDVSVKFVPRTQSSFNDGGFFLRIDGTDDVMKLTWEPTTGPDLEIEAVVFLGAPVVWDEAALIARAIQDGEAPVLVNPFADQGATEDSPFSYVIPANAFYDNEIPIGDSLAYSARLAGGAALPSWLTFDAATRTLSGTPLNANVGAISIEVTATDESGRSVADVFVLTVTNTNDAPTLANPIADQNAQDTAAFSFTVPANSFVDVDANDTFVWSATQAGGGLLPTWLSFDAATRTFTGGPQAAHIGTLDVQVTATDSAGAPVSDVFRITVAPAPDQTLTGNSANNTLTGGSGNDTLNGLGGADNMTGLLGDDFYFVDHSGDQVNEAADGGIDTVSSSITYTLGNHVEHLTLTGSSNRNGTGNSLSNTLIGNSGSNVLNGGGGNDILNGGAGADTFVFSHLPGAANADLIQGFTSSDRIHLDNAVMAALGGTGTLSSSRFWSSTTGQAHDSSDRVIYNTETGELWYDADGWSAGSAQLIATLENDPTLTAGQISVI